MHENKTAQSQEGLIVRRSPQQFLNRPVGKNPAAYNNRWRDRFERIARPNPEIHATGSPPFKK